MAMQGERGACLQGRLALPCESLAAVVGVQEGADDAAQVRLGFDGWDESYDVEVDIESGDFQPPGTCLRAGGLPATDAGRRRLTAPFATSLWLRLCAAPRRLSSGALASRPQSPGSQAP